MMRKIFRWLCVRDETRLMVLVLMSASAIFGYGYGTTDEYLAALIVGFVYILAGMVLNHIIQVIVNQSED